MGVQHVVRVVGYGFADRSEHGGTDGPASSVRNRTPRAHVVYSDGWLPEKVAGQMRDLVGARGEKWRALASCARLSRG